MTVKNEFQTLQIVIDNGCGVVTEVEREIIRGKLELILSMLASTVEPLNVALKCRNSGRFFSSAQGNINSLPDTSLIRTLVPNVSAFN